MILYASMQCLSCQISPLVCAACKYKRRSVLFIADSPRHEPNHHIIADSPQHEPNHHISGFLWQRCVSFDLIIVLFGEEKMLS